MNIQKREAVWLREIEAGQHDCEWHECDGIWWSSAVRLGGIRICLTYRSSLKAAALLGGRLPTQDEAITMFKRAAHIEPSTMQVSASTEAIYEHSRRVDTKMEPESFVDNEGKLWIAGAPAGRALNYGWPARSAPYLIAPGIRGWQPLGGAHDDGHVDYSQTLRVVRDLPPGEEPELSSLPLVERIIEISLAEVELGNLETTAQNAGPRIAEYFKRATRNGRPLGISRGNWCAVGACWATAQALQPGESMPHGFYASGIELEREAKKAGTWVGAEDAQRGDVCILPRGQPGSWTRHVCRVLSIDGDQLITVGANEGNRWRVTQRRSSDALGYVALPRDTSFELDAMHRTRESVKQAARRNQLQPAGIEAVEALFRRMDAAGGTG